MSRKYGLILLALGFVLAALTAAGAGGAGKPAGATVKIGPSADKARQAFQHPYAFAPQG
jgi:hypothetical protein